MGRGRRPVETVPDYGINIGADVTKFSSLGTGTTTTTTT